MIILVHTVRILFVRKSSQKSILLLEEIVVTQATLWQKYLRGGIVHVGKRL